MNLTITDVNVTIRTNKWFFNVFGMILSAAVVECYSCYCEEHGELYDRADFVDILTHELM